MIRGHEHILEFGENLSTILGTPRPLNDWVLCQQGKEKLVSPLHAW